MKQSENFLENSQQKSILKKSISKKKPEYYIRFNPKVKQFIKKTSEFICSHCHKKFQSQYTLQTHMSKKHNSNYLECTFCKETFDKTRLLKLHIEKNHLNIHRNVPQEIKNSCLSNSESSTNTLSDMQEQVTTHIQDSHYNKNSIQNQNDKISRESSNITVKINTEELSQDDKISILTCNNNVKINNNNLIKCQNHKCENISSNYQNTNVQIQKLNSMQNNIIPPQQASFPGLSGMESPFNNYPKNKQNLWPELSQSHNLFQEFIAKSQLQIQQKQQQLIKTQQLIDNYRLLSREQIKLSI